MKNLPCKTCGGKGEHAGPGHAYEPIDTKKTLVSVYSPKTGRKAFLVDASVDYNGRTYITLRQKEIILELAGIGSNDLFHWCG